MTAFFVTGATGVVGSALVEALLRLPEARLFLLIRAGSGDELRQRLETLLRFCGADPAAVAGRVMALAGDTTLPQFGLGPDDYREVVLATRHIVHCAGAVRMNLPLEAARASAVGAARNVIALAAQARSSGQPPPKVEFVSTVGVGGRLPGTLPERWITEEREFHNTYEQSKAEAEVLVERAIADGLPVTVHRPSMVVGDSRSGRIINFQVFYHLAEFLTGRRTGGFLPDPGQTRLDIVSSDHVARALVWSALEPATAGRVLHLCAGPEDALPIRDLARLLGQAFEAAGQPVPRARWLPIGVFRAALPVGRLFAGPGVRKALATLPIFLDYLAESQAFGNQETSRLLQAAGMTADRSVNLAQVAIRFYLDSRYGRVPGGGNSASTPDAPKGLGKGGSG
ncbi:MAG: SDR family oxidoreductase [Betaproteobacteria bacterium]